MNQNSIKMKTAQWDDRRDAVLLATPLFLLVLTVLTKVLSTLWLL